MLGKISCLIFTCMLSLALTPLPSYADGRNLIISTATTGGTYYPVGVAIGTLLTINLSSDGNTTATAIHSAGSGENIQFLRNRDADLIIIQAIFGQDAYKGEGPYKGSEFRELRSISMLWENVEHFSLLNKYVKNGNIDDLKDLGRRFSMGKRHSGAEGSGNTLFKIMGIDMEKDITPEFLAYNPSAQAMINDKIAGANLPAGPPASAVTHLFEQLGADRVTILEFTDAQLAKIQKSHPIWNRYIIPAGTYPSQEKEIRTIAQPNFLACRADLPDELVYRITKTIYDNLPFFNSIHKATKAMSLKRATSNLPAPLHPGAERYYREVGILE